MKLSELDAIKSRSKEKMIMNSALLSSKDREVINLKNDYTEEQNGYSMYSGVINVLMNASQTSRDSAKSIFTEIVTTTLKYVTQSDDYEFIIQDATGSNGVPAYEFYIKTMVNGEVSLQKPQEANGGGFVDIIAVAMKYAYLEVFNNPRTMSNTIILDEPGKMVSEEMSIMFSQYIKFLGDKYNKQTIMVTHNESLINSADKVFTVTRDNNGNSSVVETVITTAEEE